MLLDVEAVLGNLSTDLDNPLSAELVTLRMRVWANIEANRGDDVPVCFGQDDCSTAVLSICPWRMKCGEQLGE